MVTRASWLVGLVGFGPVLVDAFLHSPASWSAYCLDALLALLVLARLDRIPCQAVGAVRLNTKGEEMVPQRHTALL